MSSYNFQPSGSGGSRYNFAPSAAKPKAKHGLLHNIVADVVPTVESLVIGTGRLAKDIAAPGTHPSWSELGQEWRDALFHGALTGGLHTDRDPLARDVIESAKATPVLIRHPGRHPVQSALLFLPAVAGAARLGLATRAGYVDPLAEAPLGKITVRAAEGGAPVTTRVTPRDPYIAARMQAVDKALKAVTKPTTPVVGEFARAARAVERSAKLPMLKALADPRLAAYQKALAKLDKTDRTVLATIARVPLAKDLESWRQILRGQHTEAATRLAEVLSDPTFVERYKGFDRPKLVAAHEAAKALVGATEEIGLRTGALTPETIAAAPAIATRVARGAQVRAETLPVDEMTPVGANVRVAGQKATGKLVEVVPGKRGGTATVFYPRFNRTVKVPVASLEHELPARLTGGGTPAEIVAEVAQAGRPQPLKLPDRPLTERIGAGTSTGSGRTPPANPARFANTGALQRTGLIDITHDQLTPHYLGMARFESQQAKHALVKEAAAPIPEGAGLPAGMEWVREIRGEHIPFTETARGEHLAELDRLFPDAGERPFTLSDTEAAKNPELVLRDAQGNRLAVSRQFADGLAHQYRNEGRAIRYLFTKPLDVWRALVLNLRIPWLVNNIIGNNLLYALRFAGNGGMRAYLNMILDTKGPLAVRRLLNSEATRRTLTKEDLAEVLPEQLRGTFIGENLPTGAFGNTQLGRGVYKTAQSIGVGLAPLDRRTEQWLRRGGVNTVLRNSPEAKRIYKSMPKQTRSWRDAMLQAVKENSDLRDLTVREVNDALGDYLSLSQFERGVLRRAAPFYGWYREITRIAAHTVVDKPLRVLLLSRVAQLEADRQQDLRGDFPTFLQGSLALGPGPQGTERILALRSMNPFSTVVDIGRAASTVAEPTNRANATALLGLTNPYAEALAAELFGSARGDVASPAYLGPAGTFLNKFGLPGGILAQVAGGLPQVQAAFPPPASRLYPTRDRADIILRLLGDIRREPSLQQAHYYATNR